MIKDSSTICILIIAKNFDPNKIQLGVGVISISWLTFEILDRWINKPAYKKVQIFIANENGAPASSILHVRGNVAVPKIFPNSNYACIAPFTNWAPKEWATDSFIKITQYKPQFPE